MISMNDETRNRLKAAAERLNDLTDEKNTAVREVELFLQEISLGVEAQVLWKEGQYLVYCRRPQGKFRIMFGAGLANRESPRKPWAECTREVKMATYGLLPNLLDLIARTAEDKVKSLEDGAK